MITEPLTLTRLRSRYQDDSTQLRQSFERNGDGSAVIRRRSQIVGTLLRQLWDHVAPIAPQDDIALVAALGFSSYRFSLEWSRIEPAEGEFSRVALPVRQRKSRARLARTDPRLHPGHVGHWPSRQPRHAHA